MSRAQAQNAPRATPNAQPAQQAVQKPVRGRAGAYAALVIIACGALLELRGLYAELLESRAGAALDRGQPIVALSGAEQALAWNPYQAEAVFTHVMALRTLNRPERAQAMLAATAWHPQRGLLLLMGGEALLELNQPQRARETLWQGLWSTPIPPGGALFWRDAWRAEAGAAGMNTPPALAAHAMAEGLLLHDPTLPPGMRGALDKDLNSGNSVNPK